MFPPLVPLAALTLAFACFAQSPLPQAFEVAAIKPNAENDNRVMIRIQPGGRFTATGVNAKHLIGEAFNMRPYQINGGPGWLSTDRYDINAKAEGLPDRVPPELLRPLLRNLLEDRFKLKTHIEEKEMPIYALVAAKGGHKLTPADGSGPGPMMRVGRGELRAQRVPLAMLAQQLSQQLGRTVVDKTGLTGDWQIALKWAPEPGPAGGAFGGPPPPDAIVTGDTSGPTIFTALQEQLGLRLEAQKGPVPFLIIDSVEKPTEN